MNAGYAGHFRGVFAGFAHGFREGTRFSHSLARVTYAHLRREMFLLPTVFTHSNQDLGRQHHSQTFSQNLWYGRENIE
jgi:hypothetical protein